MVLIVPVNSFQFNTLLIDSDNLRCNFDSKPDTGYTMITYRITPFQSQHMFNSAHSSMNVCCEKSLMCLYYLDSTFSTNIVINGVYNLFVRMSAISSFVFTYFNSITVFLHTRVYT